MLNTKLETKIPPPIVALVCVAIIYLTSRHTPSFPTAFPYQFWLAVCLLACGLFFDARALFLFLKSHTTVNPLTPESASTLVKSGVYRYTRNPMYLGLALILGAWCVFLGTIIGLLGVVLFVSYINRFQIQPEEKVLQKMFGEEYMNYCQRVRRWL